MRVALFLLVFVALAGCEDSSRTPRERAAASTKPEPRRASRLAMVMVISGSPEMRRIADRVRADGDPQGVAAESEAWTHDATGATFDDHYLRARNPATITRYLAAHAGDPDFQLPADRRVVFEPLEGGWWRSYLVETAAQLDDASIARAEVIDELQTGRPVVQVTLTPAAGAAFAELTTRNAGRKMAILLDDQVRSAPVIEGRIAGGKLWINMGAGDPTALRRDAVELAALLNDGT